MTKNRKQLVDRIHNARRKIEEKANVAAYIVLDQAGEQVATIRFSYPRDGAGKLQAVAANWAAERPRDAEGKADFETWTPWQYGYATGYGYDKHTAAVSGMTFGAVTIKDDGYDWSHQLRDAGYRVIQAI